MEWKLNTNNFRVTCYCFVNICTYIWLNENCLLLYTHSESSRPPYKRFGNSISHSWASASFQIQTTMMMMIITFKPHIRKIHGQYHMKPQIVEEIIKQFIFHFPFRCYLYRRHKYLNCSFINILKLLLWDDWATIGAGGSH